MLIRFEYSLGFEHSILGRPERNIEDYVSKEILEGLSCTIPNYTADSIAKVTACLLRNILNLSMVKKQEKMLPLLVWATDVFQSEFMRKNKNISKDSFGTKKPCL